MPKRIIVSIIEDDTDGQEFLIQALKEINPSVECFTAINGQEGFKKLEKESIPFLTFILLDLNMPRMNGERVLLGLKNNPQFNDIPVAMYTTSSNAIEIEQMKLLGAVDYSNKHSDFAALKEKLHTLLSTISSA